MRLRTARLYPIAEFDRLMRKADEDFVSGREYIEQKYGSLENAFDAGYEEAYQYAGYDKTKFTLLLPDGRTFTERQDIGDGDGGLLDFLSQYPAYNDIMPMLREAAGSMPESENVFHRNTQDMPAPETADVFQSNTPTYQVGDTVYLDDRPFEITDIGILMYELRDPSQPYPVSRSENRDKLHTAACAGRTQFGTRSVPIEHAGNCSDGWRTAGIHYDRRQVDRVSLGAGG